MTKRIEKIASFFSGSYALRRSQADSRQRQRRRIDQSMLVSAEVSRLEERCLMTIVPIPPEQLANKVVELKTIFWNGGDPLTTAEEGGKTNIKSPEASGAAKYLSFTNYGIETIFPFLRTENTGKDPNSPLDPVNFPTNYYDPQDLHGKEFRQYVGYTDGTNKYLGLPSGATITIQVPLVLWDGNNISLVTDGEHLTTPKNEPMGTLFSYDRNARITVVGLGEKASDSTWVTEGHNYQNGNSPLVMFYFADQSATVSDDAPSQPAEATFRDSYLKNFINDAGQTFPLINYDVTNVNKLAAPGSMEAIDVPVYKGGPTPTYYGPAVPYGWHGSDKTVKQLNDLLEDFRDNKGDAKVGAYFGAGSPGWPTFYSPNKDDINIPSGANIFDDSPIDIHGKIVHTSNYDSNRWLLSSSGGGAITASGNGTAESPTGTKIAMNFTSQDQRSLFIANVASMKSSKQAINVTANLSPEVLGTFVDYDPSSKVLAYVMDDPGSDYSDQTRMVVRPKNGKGSGARGDVHVENGKIVSIGILPDWGGSGYTEPPEITFVDPTGKGKGAKYHADITGGTATVKIADGKQWPSGSASYVFQRPVADYAATAITNLWYSWANYYVDQFQSFPSDGVTANGNFVKEGAAFTNEITLTSTPSTPLAVGMKVTSVDAPASINPGTTILKIDGNKIYLSQIPKSDSGQFKFEKPEKLPIDAISAKYTVPFGDKFVFSASELENARRFASSVYEAMSIQNVSLEQTPEQRSAYLPRTMDVVDNVIKFYADIPTHDSAMGTKLVGEARDIVKSILRGVYDFHAIPDQSQWYPDPAKKTGNQNFNVYNLDPYVWFVHKVAGLNGYAFSVDDDVANPGAGGPDNDLSNHKPSTLAIGFAGIKPPKVNSPLGKAKPLPNQNEWFPRTPWGSFETTATIGVWDGPDDPKGYYKKGDSYITLTDPDPLVNQRNFWQITNPGPGEVGAYVFATGFIVPGTTLVFKGPGTDALPRIILSQPAISTSTNIKIKIDASLFDIPAVPVRNPTFEAPKQTAAPFYKVNPKGPTVFWTFEGTAGIAGNGSVYTKNNPAPVGSQVGFIQNRGSISQVVRLAAGQAYAVSFRVAQRKLDDGTVNAQTLQIKYDNTVIDNFEAKSTSDGKYVLFTSKAFKPKSTGLKKISIIGTNTKGGDNTALIDNVSIIGSLKVLPTLLRRF
jgi:hypothetical protein